MCDPPWALFVLDKEVSNEYLNDALHRAYNGDDQSDWYIWVATDSYDDMPPLPEVHKPQPAGGTQPPLPASYSSPWIGKTVEDCAKWLQEMPRFQSTNEKKYVVDTGVNDETFLVLNEFSKEEDSVLVCRIAKEENGESRVDYFPQGTDEVQRQMWTNWSSMFDEKIINYQRVKFRDKLSDRSRSKPLSSESGN